MRNTLLVAAAAAALLAGQAQAAPAGVKVGVLRCHIESGWGFIIGSSKGVECAFHPNGGPPDRYKGSISKLGVDIGYTASGTMIWDVVAPTSDVASGALAGSYAGATAGATVGAGLGANVLIGGLDKSIALQPVSVEGNTGLDVNAGVGELSLQSIEPPERIREMRTYHEEAPAPRDEAPPDQAPPPPSDGQ